MTKREKTEISKLINSLTTWNNSIAMLEVKKAKGEVKFIGDEMRERMRYFNEAADKLTAMGIPVIRYDGV